VASDPGWSLLMYAVHEEKLYTRFINQLSRIKYRGKATTS
jgi:hypothetical protein